MLSYLRSAIKASSSANSEEVTVATEAVERLTLSADAALDLIEWKETIFDIIRNIKDPEKEESLEELDVVRENLVFVSRIERSERPDSRNRTSDETSFYSVRVEFVPTVPHCSLATLIGLCLITKLNRELPSGRFVTNMIVIELVLYCLITNSFHFFSLSFFQFPPSTDNHLKK